MSSLPGAPGLLPALVADSSALGARLPPVVGSTTVPLALPPGSRVVAEVIHAQTDGQVLLRLGETLLATTLPGEHPVGEQLSMVVLSEPGAKPLLLLAGAGSSAAAGAAPQAQAQLSSTAQLLGELQQQPAAAVRAPTAVWADPAAGASAQLAGALEQSVKSSGLFYESHLAAWVQGQLPTLALLSEPQGRLSSLLAALPQTLREALAGPPAAPPLVLPQAPAATGSAPSAPQSSQAPTQSPASQQAAPTDGAPAPGQPAAAQAAAAGQTMADAAGVPLRTQQALHVYAGMQAQAMANASNTAQLPAQLHALVQQQLATLAQGAVVWVGQVWPGQDMQWRIEREQGRARPDDEGDAQGARGWTSVLRLDLPRLGSLVATVHLGADQHVRVHLQHAAQAAGALRAQRDALRSAVQAAGLQLDDIALQQSDPGAAR